MTPITDIDEQTRNEENTKLNYITPEIQKKWSAEGDQIIMEYGKTNNVYFTDGQIIVGSDGNVIRGERKKVDYLLLYKYNLPLALVEAKGLDHDVCEGVSQAIEYARLLDVPFAYASNGKCFHEEDLLLGTNREFAMNEFPTSQELWERYRKANEITDEQSSMIAVPYYQGADGRKPRYYQRNAINRCIDRIAKGQKRLLLVMATGTGKTFVAMQIIYRLYEAGTKTGNLNFNCLIMKMPDQVRDYVIIHELAHRKELNHSSKYWAIVAEYCPWYKQAKQWLKDNGQGLMES